MRGHITLVRKPGSATLTELHGIGVPYAEQMATYTKLATHGSPDYEWVGIGEVSLRLQTRVRQTPAKGDVSPASFDRPKKMKTILPIIAICFLALGFNAEAQKFHAKSNAHATLSHVVIPVGEGVPVVSFLSATSDKAASVVTFYTASAGSPITLATNATSQATIYMNPTNSNFTVGDDSIMIIRDVSTGDCYRVTETSRTATTVTMTANPGFSTVAGDMVYLLTAGPTIPVAAATKQVDGPMWAGTEGRPALVTLDGTSACSLNAVFTEFK